MSFHNILKAASVLVVVRKSNGLRPLFDLQRAIRKEVAQRLMAVKLFWSLVAERVLQPSV